MADFLSLDDNLTEQISQFMRSLAEMEADVSAAIDGVADRAAAEIMTEQRRLLSKQHPQLASKVQAVNKSAVNTAKGDHRVRVEVGYSTETIQEHPEVLVIEFGRPGKSSRCSKALESVERKRKDGSTYYKHKGEFPSAVSHIRAGFDLAKPKILKIMEEELLERVTNDFSGNR